MIRTYLVVFFILSVLALSTPVMAQSDDDPDPPVLSLVAPYEGSFSGSLEFSARSSDDLSGVESVEFGYGSSEVSLTWFSSSGGQDGYWSSSLDTTDIADGYYNVSLRSTDSSGNQRILLWVAEILVDNNPPVVSLVAPESGTFSGSLEFSARSSDDLSGVESVEFGYGSSEVSLTWFSSSGGQDGYWSSSLDTTDIADGYYNVSLRSTDSSGNQRILLWVAEILVDNNPPVVSLVAPESGTFSGSLEFSATSTDDLSGVENVAFGYRPVSGRLKWFSGREAEKGVWQDSFDTTRIQDGSYSLSVRSTDFAGNREVASDVWEIVVDNQEGLDYEEDDVRVDVSGVVTDSDLVYKISEGSTARFVFRRSGLPVSSVSFKVSEEVRNVRVTVSGLSERPSPVSVVNGTVYRYVTLNNSKVVDSLVSSLTVGFSVDKDFVSDNNVSEDDVILVRYVDGEWVETDVRLISSAGSTYSYEASSEGFGHYAIVLKAAPSVEGASESSPVVAEPGVEKLPEPEDVVPEGPDRNWVLYTVMTVIVIMALVGGVIVFVHMRLGRLSHENVEDTDDAGEGVSNSLANESSSSEYKF